MNTKVRDAVLRRDKHTCRYCGHTSREHLTIDHVIPLSRGGHPVKLANLVVACFICNQRKANQTPEEAGMTILTEGFSYTPPGKLNDNVSEPTPLLVVNHGFGKKKRKKRERRRRKAIIRYWERHGFLPEDLTQFEEAV